MKFVASFAVGGSERQFVRLALDLDPSRFDVEFGCLRRFGQLLEPIEERGMPVLDYDVSSFFSVQAMRAQLRLATDIRRRGIHIVHTYNFYANVFGIPAARMAGARVIASIRDMGIYLTPRQRIAQRAICSMADQILVNAAAIRDWLIADGYAAEKIVVIPNGIDVDRFPADDGSLRREFGIADGTPLIGLAGRLAPMKGVEDFLVAAATVASRVPSAQFIVIGSHRFGPPEAGTQADGYFADLIDFAAGLGLRERVIFTGYRADVDRLLPQLSVSVQPSLSEGLSNTVLESMAAGIPVVATNVGGTTEVLRDGENGLLVQPGRPDAIAAAIEKILASPELAARLGNAARDTIATNYSTSRMVQRTTQLYEQP